MKIPSVLIVEDDGLVALNLVQLLEKSGYDVPDPLISGEGAIDYVNISCPDLILMDIRLAGEIDGIGAAREIRKSSGVPVIFLTAYSDLKQHPRLEEVNPAGFITKPFLEEEVRSAIVKALNPGI